MPDEYEKINRLIWEAEQAIRSHQVALAILGFRLEFYRATRSVMDAITGWPRVVAEAAERIANGREE